MSVWSDTKVTDRLLELIKRGVFRDSGVEGVREVLITEFPELKLELSVASVRAKLAHIIWSDPHNKERLELLKGRRHIRDEDIRALFPLLPPPLIESKLQRLKKRAENANMLHQRTGGLIQSPNELQPSAYLPEASLAKPFVVEGVPENPTVMAINAPQVGLIYNADLERNVFRNALALAQAKGCDVVLITGNLIHLDLMRASRNKPYRSALSGMTVEPEVLERLGGYDSAEEVMELLESDELVFLTLRERFETLLRGLRKIFTDDGNPIFNGKVLITFGRNEEELIYYASAEELRARVAIERERIKLEISILRQERNAKGTPDGRKEQLQQRIEELTARLKRTIMSNVSDEAIREMGDRIGGWVIQRLQEVIPNSQVIGTGEVCLEVGGKTIQVFQTPVDQTTDTYLGRFTANLRKRTRMPRELGDLILVGGRTVLTGACIPLRYHSKERGSTTVDVEQLPMLLDRQLLASTGRKMIKEGSPLLRLIGNEHFYTGAVIFQWVDGILRKERYGSEYLSRPDNFSAEALQQLVEGENVFYGYVEGDGHEGHPWVVLYPSPERPFWVRHDEACLDMLERLEAPILWYLNLGDIVQGHHFPAEVENHPGWLRPNQFLGKLETAGSLDEAVRLAFYDKVRSGLIRTEDQLKYYMERFVKPQLVPFIAQVLIRARKLGFKTQGTLGAVTLLSGNHVLKTTEGEMGESTWLKDRLVAEVYIYAREHNLPLSRAEIEEAIKAPMFGQESLAEGLFEIEGRALYALSARHKPVGRATKYADPVRRARQAFGKRGSTNPLLLHGQWILALAGHTHMSGNAAMPQGDYHSCGSQTDTDPFGEMLAYPLNIISVKILGMPADGTDRGPRVEIALRDDLIRRYVAKPWKINGKRLFANAIGWEEE